MTTATSSFKEYIAANMNGNPIYTFHCTCKKCAGKKAVRVEKTKVLSVVETLKFPDLMTTKQFDKMHHDMVQMFG